MNRFGFQDSRENILSFVKETAQEIKIAVSWLTDNEIFNILLDKLNSGIKVSVITRNDLLNNHENALDWNHFLQKGGELRFCSVPNMLHYKFAIKDGKAVVLTSHNWACFQGNNNRDMFSFFNDTASIQSFEKEFSELESLFEKIQTVERIKFEDVNPKLHGFYELTLIDDLKNQVV